MKRKLFVLALWAIQPDPEFTKTGEQRFSVPVDASDPRDRDFKMAQGVRPGFEWAFSQAEAEEAGILGAREQWPESEGWVNHGAMAAEVQADLIREAYRGFAVDDGADDEEDPTFEM